MRTSSPESESYATSEIQSFYLLSIVRFPDSHAITERSGFQLRAIIAVPGSGSTLLTKTFQQISGCAVTSRLVSQGDRNVESPFEPDYSIFQDPNRCKVYQQALERGCDTLITKEELGREEWKDECDYSILRFNLVHESTKPAFLFRDPLRVYGSWKNFGWDRLPSFLTAYRNLFRMWSEHPQSKAYIYELRDLCDYWDLDLTENMLDSKQPIEDFVFSSEREECIHTIEKFAVTLDTVRAHDIIVPDIKSHKLISNSEIEVIEGQLGPLYLSSYGPRVHDLSAWLREHTWFGFDLDDTLHEFRRASKAASVAVFHHISDHSRVTVYQLSASYAQVLAQKTASAFTDGKTSDYYRQERFRALLEIHKLETEDTQLVHLATLYKDALGTALEVKPGAITLLRYLRYIGKKVAIVTEGPQDAQEWTIEKLELAEHLDVLVTTNKFGKSKVDGLFGAVLTHLGIEGKDMVYVGDNYQRDILTAQKEGITTVHLSEVENVVFEKKGTRINSLAKLENILRLRNEGITRRSSPPLSG